ncbi:MAG TPA: hypothetical protein VMS76_07645 [Planctomycetota bacterium]|nr:hypothetical protein [Planctomycetota bacterium]
MAARARKRYLMDADSGVGTRFLAVDVDGDGALAVVTHNEKGVFLHLRWP